MPGVAAMMVPFASVFSIEEGTWKSVVEPVFDTAKSVEVDQFPVEELMVKSMEVEFGVVVGLADMEINPVGEEVPTPILPWLVIVVVPVAPKDAVEPLCVRAKILVPVALVNVIAAKLVVPLKVLVLVKVLVVYVFGMVVELCV